MIAKREVLFFAKGYMNENFFLQLSILLGLTVSIAFIMRLLRQPLVVAYIAAGLIAGPLFLQSVQSEQIPWEAFAQFGIVLLLFIVGLSLNIDYIKRVGREVFFGGTIQFFITALVGFGVMRLFGFSLVPAFFVAVAITFSSTIIVVKLLVEKKDLETLYGQYSVGLLLVQDIIAIFLLIVLNTLKTPGAWQFAVVATLGKIALLILVIGFLSKKILPWVMSRVATSGEMLFIFTIAWCFGVASLVYWLGFGVEIGAVIAGLSLGSSPYQAEISSRLRPLRDFFIVVFFIVLGSKLHLGNIMAVVGPGLILSAFVLIVQPMILYVIMRRLGYKRRSAFLAGVTAAQVSEFGFILIFKGQELGYLYGQELALLTLVALVTIFISSYLITYNNQLYHFLRPLLDTLGKEDSEEKSTPKTAVTVWVFGYHRIGWKICEALSSKKISFAVIDFDPQAIKKLQAQGIAAYFGDISDIEFLETVPLGQSKLIISTIPDAHDQETMIQHVRKQKVGPFIIANLHHVRDIDSLYKAGANYVMLTHLLGGQWLSELIREKKQWSKKTFSTLRREQEEEMKMRHIIRVLE